MATLQPSITQPLFYHFDQFTIDVRRRTLFNDGELVPLTAKLFSLLLVLITSQGIELSKDHLMNAVWPDSRVEMSNLTQSIFLLRRLLGHREDGRRLIITIPGKGYLFTGIVNPEYSRESSPGPQVSPIPDRSSRSQSVAVLPFHVFDLSEQTRYLGIGIADALITRLSHIEHIYIRPVGATRKYSGHPQEFQKTGRALGVDFLIAGTVHVELIRAMKSSPIRVMIQLVDVQNGNVTWSDSVEGGLDEILTLHDRLAGATGHAIARSLTMQEKEQLTKRHTEDNGAYQDYLKGRYYAGQYTARGWSKAITCFSRAVQKDPNYALAYCGIADAHYMAANLYSSPLDAMSKAQTAANRALILGGNLSEAHTSVALVKGFFEWDWAGSEVSFREAIRLNEKSASAHFWYGRLLTTAGRFAEAADELKCGLQLDPLSAAMNAELGRTLYYARRYEEAKEQLRETLELDPNFWPAHLFLGWVYEQQGHLAETIAILHRASELDDNPRIKTFLGVAYASAGEDAQAEKILVALKDQCKKRYVAADYIAALYAALGDTSRAFRYFAKAHAGRSGWLVWLGVDPHYDSLRHDPRFKSLIADIGIPKSPGNDWQPS
jgi:DNA-binding winged helix-turn-helix (wHTH) protein/tetratricopeptide (TPR) repeat protein